ncbi:rhodanese-like domain-containing protein [Aspergillus undulatus]|uniref:rhodanese-like domain-containing protein n=1 Tax=Aspergillus undulatus TaxID=1810928 RepID=UPI003CCC8FF4
MASLLPITRRSIEAANLFSRATKTKTACTATAAARTLPLPSTRQLTTISASALTSTSSLVRPRCASPKVNSLRSAQLPRYAIRWNSNSNSGFSESEQSSTYTPTPSFRQWVFEDINALLPSTAGGSPPSSPQKSLILVDVREPAEMKGTGVIPSAVAVPLASQPDALFLTPEEFETRFGYPKPGAEKDKSKGKGKGDIVFYCKAGVRARAAAQLAVQAGYDVERIGVYEGSWLDWAQNGGRVEKWDGEGFE